MAALIRIAGYNGCGAFRKANAALLGLQAIFPDRFSIETIDSVTRGGKRENHQGVGVDASVFADFLKCIVLTCDFHRRLSGVVGGQQRWSGCSHSSYFSFGVVRYGSGYGWL